MDKVKNPFSPGAGAPPPELAGREEVIDQARILLARTLARRPEKSMLMTGLRGVGKTVLLNELQRVAEEMGYRTILVETHENKSLGSLLAPHLRKLLFALDRMAGAGDKARRALGVLKSFVGALKVTVSEIEFGLDIDPETGTADSGDLEIDMPDLFTALGEAAQERKTGIAILIDEIQYFSSNELSALIMAMHRVQQRQLPVVLIGAGLPTLAGLAGDSKSYSERLFSFPNISPLPEPDAVKAVRDPMNTEGVTITEDALSGIFRLTRGYPYFLQEWGYQAWNQALTSPITLQIVEQSSQVVVTRLDQNFFRVRFDRLTPAEKRYLRAMAELGPGPHKTGDIADALHAKVSSLSKVRDSLIKKGMVYSPAHGDVAFTVPLFDEFMRRAIPAFDPAVSSD